MATRQSRSIARSRRQVDRHEVRRQDFTRSGIPQGNTTPRCRGSSARPARPPEPCRARRLPPARARPAAGEDGAQSSGAVAEFNGAQAGEIVSVAPADTLLSLISRASAALEGARTLAETVQAMKLAQAAKELGRIIGAANEARADCLRVELLAQMRIAREYAGAQVRGEVAKADGTTHHRPKEGVPATDTLPATVDDLGLDRRRMADWRKMADAGEAVVLGAISDALDEGREATAADVKRAVSGGPVFRYFTGNTEWYTPGEFVEAAREVMGGIDLDPASCAMAQETVRAARYYTKDDCGLAHPWHGRIWLNPPYSVGLVDQFVAKLVEEYQTGNVSSAVVLTDNRTDTAWFHALAAASARLCFTRRRIHFHGEGISVSRPANGSAFFYLGSDPGQFDRVFSRFGLGAQIVFTHDAEARP